MRLPSVPTPALVDHLNTTYFHRVWNAPDDHGRANFTIDKAALRLQRGAVPINLSVVGLPTTDTVYAVYRVSVNVFGRFVSFLSDDWITDSDISNRFAVSITTYTTGGRVIPAGTVNFKYDRFRATVLIAIAQNFTSKCTGQSYPELNMTVFKDTSYKTPTLTSVMTVTSSPSGPGSASYVSAQVLNQITTYPAGTMVYINGWLYNNAKLPALMSGDIVSLYTDPDVVGYCDITVDDNQTGYYSNLYGEYREVLHIPKVLNPNNYVITVDTLFMGILDPESGKGVYGHRLDPHALESITHNDFSISRSVLQAFQNSVGSQSVIVRLYVRMATEPSVIGREVNQIVDLYSFDDFEIQDQLVGISTQQIKEWNASYLEQSTYLDLLYVFGGYPSGTVLTKLVEAMGYYDVVSTIAQSQVSYKYDGAAVVVAKPVVLRGYDCEAIVYSEGRKVPKDAVVVLDECALSITIGFTDKNYIAPGSLITIYMTEGGERVPRYFSPTLTNPSIVMDSEDYDLVKIISYPNDQKVWSDTTRQGFVSIPVSPADYKTVVNSDNTVTWTVSSVHYGSQFYLVPICAMTTSTYPVDNFLTDKEPIIIPLEMTDSDGNVIPLLTPRSLEVYLNGYRLIENIDYSVSIFVGSNNDVLQRLLMVSNSLYLNLSGTGNTIEVVVHSGEVVSRDSGYVISNFIHRDTPPMVWSKTCGRVFGRGKLLHNPSEQGNTLVASSPVIDGSPYLTEWTQPYSVTKLLRSISADRDSDLRVRVGRLLGASNPNYPTTVIINQLYSLYSPYLAKIAHDVAAGIMVIYDDPVLTQFLKQFDAYKPLYAKDPTLGTVNTEIDRRYVTIAAHYVNLAVNDPNQMILLQRLIGMVLTPSDLSIESVLL